MPSFPWAVPCSAGLSNATCRWKTARMNTADSSLTITRPDDWHLHLLDGAILDAVIGAVARQFSRAIVLPNLIPPVVTTALAVAYRRRLLKAIEHAGLSGRAFVPLMKPILTA